MANVCLWLRLAQDLRACQSHVKQFALTYGVYYLFQILWRSLVVFLLLFVCVWFCCQNLPVPGGHCESGFPDCLSSRTKQHTSKVKPKWVKTWNLHKTWTKYSDMRATYVQLKGRRPQNLKNMKNSSHMARNKQKSWRTAENRQKNVTNWKENAKNSRRTDEKTKTKNYKQKQKIQN